MPNDMDTAFSRHTPDECEAHVGAMDAPVEPHDTSPSNEHTSAEADADTNVAAEDGAGASSFGTVEPAASEEELNAREVIARRALADRYGSGDRVTQSYAQMLARGREYANAVSLLLAAVMQLYLDMTDQPAALKMIDQACKDAGIPFTKRTDLIQKLIRLAINDAEPAGNESVSTEDPGKHETTVQKLANLYARALRFALHHDVPPHQLPRFVAAHGGVKGCVGKYAVMIRRPAGQDAEGSTSTSKKKMKVTWEENVLEGLAAFDERGTEEIECMVTIKRKAAGRYEVQKMVV